MIQDKDIFKIVEKRNWNTLKSFLTNFQSSWIFRGQANSQWLLRTTIEREKIIYRQGIRNLEFKLLNDLDANIHNYNITKIPYTNKQKLILLQHFGAPTRVLDFTYSPYVASYFAIIDNYDYKYSSIYAIDVVELWNMLDNIKDRRFSKYVTNNVANSFNDINNISLLYCNLGNEQAFNELILEKFNSNQFVIPITPDYHDERTIPQASTFLTYSDLHSSFLENLYSIVQNYEGKSPFYKIIFPSNIRIKALRDLNLMNINHASLFPNLEGFISGMKFQYQIQEYDLLNYMQDELKK